MRHILNLICPWLGGGGMQSRQSRVTPGVFYCLYIFEGIEEKNAHQQCGCFWLGGINVVRSSLFWNVMQRSLAVSYWCFRTTYRSHLQLSGSATWPLIQDCHDKSSIQHEDSFHQYIGLKFKEETTKMLYWRISFYGAEIWTLPEVDQKYLESFEMWCWRRTEKISRTDHVRNEILCSVKEERNVLHTVNEGRLTGLVTSCVGTAF
jgi:hypothetical protein